MEEWKDVPFCVGLYQCGTNGEVRSLDRYVKQKSGAIQLKKGRILKPSMDKRGYARVTLTINGEPVFYRRCRLVYLTFHGPIPDGMQVNHIDENKSNDRPDNLNLMTPKENSNWGTRNYRASVTRGYHVLQFSLAGDFIAEFHSTREAARQLHIENTHIVQVCKGKRKKCGGYIWRYKKPAIG